MHPASIVQPSRNQSVFISHSREDESSRISLANLLRLTGVAIEIHPRDVASMTQASRIGERLRQLREDRGLSQRIAAQGLGVSPTSIMRWELGKSIPNISMRLKLAEFYGVPVSELNALAHEDEEASDGDNARDDSQEHGPD